MSNHPKRGLAVTDFRPNPEVSYRLRYTQISNQGVPAPAGMAHAGLQNRTGVFLIPCVPLRYALPGSTNAYQRQRKEGQGVSYLHPEI